jgi:asparagine synthase (glutamine-hydrolysing)
LRGVFSFAIWDESAQRLVGVRDQAGIRSFFYHIGTGHRVDFSSNLAHVLEAMPFARRVNAGRIGEFLAGVDSKPSNTFYEGVKRLPAAHVLVVTPSGVCVEPYWSVGAVEPRGCPSDADCEQGFRQVFDMAVTTRMSESGRSGVFLSGGLDSSSVAATASQAFESQHVATDPVHTFSAVYDALEACDERAYIDDVLRRGAYNSHFVLGERQKPLKTLQVLLEIHQEPFFAPNMGVSQLLFEKANQQNIETVLHGHGGDEVISQGYGRLKELARAGQWRHLARELRGAAQIAGNSTWYALFGMYVERFKIHPAAQRSALWARVARKVIHVARRRFGSDNSSRVSRRAWNQLVDPDFAADIDLEGRVRSARKADPRRALDEAERHARVLAGPRQAHALETIARTGRHFGVETVFPFWDIDLVEYCLSLPSDQKMREGWGRWILRRSMEGRLPPSVQWRRDKTDFTDNLRHGLVQEKNQLNDLLLDDEGVAKEYLQTSVIQDLRSTFVADPDDCTPSDLFVLWRVAVLIAWLRHVNQS